MILLAKTRWARVVFCACLAPVLSLGGCESTDPLPSEGDLAQHQETLRRIRQEKEEERVLASQRWARDIAQEVLRTRMGVHSAEDLWEALPRREFETRGEYAERILKVSGPGGFFYIPVEIPGSRFDVDNSVLDVHYFSGFASILSSNQLITLDSQTTESEYTGSNAFGTRVRVNRMEGVIHRLELLDFDRFGAGSNRFRVDEDHLGYRYFFVGLPMSRETAQALKPSLGLLLGVAMDEGSAGREEFLEQEPTFRDRNDTRLLERRLVGNLKLMIFYNLEDLSLVEAVPGSQADAD